jgi:hypothetical protein
MVDTEFGQFGPELLRSDAASVAEAVAQVRKAKENGGDLVAPLERLWREVAETLAGEPGRLAPALIDWMRRLERACRDQLRSQGYRFEPQVGQALDTVAEEWIGSRRDWFAEDARPGAILEVRRHAMLAPDGRMPVLADVVVCVGRATPAFELLAELRAEIVQHYDATHPTVAELELAMQRALETGGVPYQEVMAAMGILYQHKTAHGFPSRALFRGLRQRIQQFLDQHEVREFIREGDGRQLIDKETGRIRVENAEVLTSKPDCVVKSILKPGFERNGQTIQDAVITVGPRERA